jgi:hypothetical protein
MAMKKIVLFAFSLLIISAGVNAQKMNAVKTDLFSAFLRTGVIKYERAFTEDISAQIGFFYTGFTPRDSETKLNGFGITPEFRYYLSSSPAPNGTYLAPNFRYMSVTVSDPVENADGTLTSYSFAINLGKQVVLKDVIAIDAWVGPAYAFRSVSASAEGADTGPLPEVNGFGIRAGIAIGIVF